MDILSTLAPIVLWTTKEAFIIPVLVIGVLIINRQAFTRLLFITLLTMIFTPLLKSIWQIPLPQHLGIKGYAFPSGHMQLAFVFWGWLAWEFNRIWSWLLAAIFIPLIGWALIYQGYHQLTDILGAMGFGLLSLIVFALLLRVHFLQTSTRIGLLFIVIGGLMIALTPGHQPHVWISLGAILGFVLGEMLYISMKLEKKYTIGENSFRLLASFAGIAVIYCTFSFLALPLALQNFLQFVLIAFWISWSVDALLNRYKSTLDTTTA